MDIASIALHFLCAAVAGFLIMSIFGVQALVALCSSISLARRPSRTTLAVFVFPASLARDRASIKMTPPHASFNFSGSPSGYF